jgi:hypothetical protein
VAVRRTAFCATATAAIVRQMFLCVLSHDHPDVPAHGSHLGSPATAPHFLLGSRQIVRTRMEPRLAPAHPGPEALAFMSDRAGTSEQQTRQRRGSGQTADVENAEIERRYGAASVRTRSRNVGDDKAFGWAPVARRPENALSRRFIFMSDPNSYTSILGLALEFCTNSKSEDTNMLTPPSRSIIHPHKSNQFSFTH